MSKEINELSNEDLEQAKGGQGSIIIARPGYASFVFFQRPTAEGVTLTMDGPPSNQHFS